MSESKSTQCSGLSTEKQQNRGFREDEGRGFDRSSVHAAGTYETFMNSKNKSTTYPEESLHLKNSPARSILGDTSNTSRNVGVQPDFITHGPSFDENGNQYESIKDASPGGFGSGNDVLYNQPLYSSQLQNQYDISPSDHGDSPGYSLHPNNSISYSSLNPTILNGLYQTIEKIDMLTYGPETKVEEFEAYSHQPNSTTQQIDSVEMDDVYRTKEIIKRCADGISISDVDGLCTPDIGLKVKDGKRVTFSAEEPVDRMIPYEKYKDIEREFNILKNTHINTLRCKSKIYRYIYNEIRRIEEEYNKKLEAIEMKYKVESMNSDMETYGGCDESKGQGQATRGVFCEQCADVSSKFAEYEKRIEMYKRKIDEFEAMEKFTDIQEYRESVRGYIEEYLQRVKEYVGKIKRNK